MISCKSLCKRYDNVPVLNNITFTVKEGERVSLIGPGSSGKTTILKILLGLEEKDKGDSQLFGHNLQLLSNMQRNAIFRKMGVAFQQGGLFDFMTVKENLAFAMRNMKKEVGSKMDEKIQILLDAVKLSRTSNMLIHELSGGMKKRVGIARALCNDPEIAIFDEPTSGLDPVTSTIILNMILDLSVKLHTTMLIATSNVEIAIRFAKRIVVVHEGRVLADGPWRDLLVDGSQLVKEFLGVRLIGLDVEYMQELGLPESFLSSYQTGHKGSAIINN